MFSCFLVLTEPGSEMRGLVVTILLLILLAGSDGVLLDKYGESYVKLAVSEYEREPSNSRFQSTVEPPLQHDAADTSSPTRHQRAFFPPKDFALVSTEPIPSQHCVSPAWKCFASRALDRCTLQDESS